MNESCIKMEKAKIKYVKYYPVLCKQVHTKESGGKATFLLLSVIVPKAFGIRNPSGF